MVKISYRLRVFGELQTEDVLKRENKLPCLMGSTVVSSLNLNIPRSTFLAVESLILNNKFE